MGKGNGRAMVFDAMRAARKWMWCLLPAVAAGLVAALTAIPGATGAAWVIVCIGGAWLAASTAFWVYRFVILPGSGQGILERDKRRSEAHGGMASPLDVWEKASKGAMRQQAPINRPSFHQLTWWETRRLAVYEYACLLGELGLGIFPWHKVYSPPEDTTGKVGGPRSGKTAALAHQAYHAPGPLVMTSTRKDMAEWVYAKRTANGAAFHVWNPTTYVKVPSTVRWRVLTGCKDYQTAARRANGMTPPVGDSAGAADLAYWRGRAVPLLGTFMWAASISGRNMRAVYRWTADNPPEGKDTCQARHEIEAAIKAHGGDEAEVRLNQIKEHYTKGHKTRSSVTHSMQGALDWLQYPAAVELGDSPEESTTLNVRRLLAEGETLSIFGHEEQEDLACLNRVLMDEIAHQARELAGEYPEERFDPPVTMCLDELALVCKIPVDRWSADMGGRGVTIHYSVQSLAQMRQKFGRETTAAILGNTNTFTVFGGGNSAEDLSEISTLAGKSRYKNAGEKKEASDSHRIDDVMSEGEIRALEKGKALLFRSGMRPLLVRTPRVWEIDGIQRANLSPPALPAVAAAVAAEVVLPVQAATEEVPS